MRIKGLIDEDFLQYKKPAMFIATAFCDFKCEKDSNHEGICQNSSLAKSEIIEIDDMKLVQRYLNNDITKAVVFGGLEPFNQSDELLNLITEFRKNTQDTIIIYTGYYKNEIIDILDKLKHFSNIIVKFGRYIPNQTPHIDDILGIELASDNQYAEYISEYQD